MSIDTSNNRTGTLEDRLNKRRRLRTKNGLDKTSVDNLDRRSIQQTSTTTRSLDRTSSKRTSQLSPLTSSAISTTLVDQRKSSSVTSKYPDTSPTDKFFLKQNHLLSSHQTDFNSSLEQTVKSQSLEPIHERETSSKPSPTTQQQRYSHQEDKPVAIKETVLPVSSPVIPLRTTERFTPVGQKTDVHSQSSDDKEPVIIRKTISPILPQTASSTTNEKFKPVQQETQPNSHSPHNAEPIVLRKTTSPKLPPMISPRITKKSIPNHHEIPDNPHSNHDEEPVIVKETISPRLPPIIIPRTSKKPNALQQVTSKHPISNRLKDLSQTSFDYPSSYPQYATDRQQIHFSFPPPDHYPIVRSASEQIVSTNKLRHQPVHSKFAKQNSLALSYVFNKRFVDAELAQATSFDSEQSKQKTVWD